MNVTLTKYFKKFLLCGSISLIDRAVEYIRNHGLRFNPDKSECMLFGKCPFTAIPRWTMNNKYLNVAPSIKYLGTSLCHDNGDMKKSNISAISNQLLKGKPTQ